MPLLTTKLHIPGKLTHCVPRPRLFERLDAFGENRLALVTAPTGFGKTTLLAEWVRREQGQAAWLSLDAGDNDPARFWEYVLGALRRILPGVGVRTTEILAAGEPIEVALTPLLNELAGMSGRLRIILDDYHCISSEAIHSSLSYFIERMPSHVLIVVASRALPPLQLARLRARGELGEVRAAEIAFTPQEAHALVRATTGDTPPADEIDELVALADGWAVGLQLAALSIRDGQGSHARSRRVRDRFPYVAEYLEGEILGTVRPDLKPVLTSVTIAARINGRLCQHLCGNDTCGQLLADLASTSFYLQPLDGEPGWYRVHPLFGAIIRERLESDDIERTNELHRKASEWFQEQGMAADAVEHLWACGDRADAVRLAERTAEGVLARGELGRLLQWSDMFPDAMIAQRSRLALALAWAQTLRGSAATARTYVSMASLASAPHVHDGLADINGHLAALNSALDQLRADSDPDGDSTMAARFQPDFADSERWPGISQSPATYIRTPAQHNGEKARFGLAEALPKVAALQLKQGKLTMSAATFHEVLELLADDEQGGSQHSAAQCHIGLAAIDFERNLVDSAMRHLSEGLQCARETTDVPLLLDGYGLLARIHQARGDVDGAIDAIDRAEALLRRHGASAATQFALEARRVGLLLSKGDIAAAAAWAQAVGPLLDASSLHDPQIAADVVMLARVMLAQRRSDEAFELLAIPLRVAEESGQNDTVIKVLVVQALALEQSGETEQALSAIARATTLAAAEGYVRTIIDEGEPMTRLLKKLRISMEHEGIEADQDTLTPHVIELLRALGGMPPPPTNGNGHAAPATALPTLLTPISDREIEVLRLIADGKSNASIADALYISVSTVKTHINNLYSKLSVESRTQALARAREYNLI